MKKYAFRSLYQFIRLPAGAAALFMLSGLQLALGGEGILASEDFENGIDGWQFDNPDQVEVITEPGTSNSVLQLTPKSRDFVSAIPWPEKDWKNVRVEGRFLFPTDGDGYLGFIYHHQADETRTDFGCVYVKSNGSYVRVSPHYDGNPSWRLYEEYRADLEGEQSIQVGAWYAFRLDVQGAQARLYIGDMDRAVASFDQAPTTSGAIGFEARPGRGEPVWVDDIVVSALPGAAVQPVARAQVGPSWEIYGPLEPGEGDPAELPELDEQGWRPFYPDPRGALITGAVAQFRSGEMNTVYLRTSVQVAEGEIGPQWLAVSTANRLDIWYRGFYRGTVAGERFIWQDFLDSREHPGDRISLASVAGTNELIIRVHGGRFAGGGLYVRLVDIWGQSKN
jgi:hypothetical protein